MPHRKFAAMTGMPEHMVGHSHMDHDGHRTACPMDAHHMHQFLMEEKHEMHDGKMVHPSLRHYH